MNCRVYAVKDELVGKFLQPMFIQTEPEALRVFKHMINTTPIWKSNPAHFSLYQIGEFDEEQGFLNNTTSMIQGGLSVLERTKDE